MKIHAHFQQKNGGDPTPEWQEIRTGCVTASEFDQFCKADGTLRTGEMPKTYLAQKLFEKWTGRQKVPFFTQAVNNGIIVEEKAAAFASLEYGLDIQHVGFVSSDDDKWGCSPDGLIGFYDQVFSKTAATHYPNDNEGERHSGIEIKCPELSTHIKYLLDGKLPADYVAQVQGSMLVTGCSRWHFLSYPLACYLDGFPPLHLVVERDEEFCENLSDSLAKFLAQLETAWNRLVEINGAPPPPRQKFMRYAEPPPHPETDDLTP